MPQQQSSAAADYTRLKGPGKYHVIMLNDDSTPMEFVIEILMTIFRKSYEEASEVMMQVHEQGRGIAGTYSYEVAEQKSIETTNDARAHGYPLDVTLEEE